ncbi:hypothetical protein HDU98_011942, partial [Podochytrium sp. JEL0797]
MSAIANFTLGAWLFNGTMHDWNTKMGRNYASFQTAEDIPFALAPGGNDFVLHPNATSDFHFLSNVSGWDDGTDASVFYSIYNWHIMANGSMGLDIISDDSITALAQRLAAIEAAGRKT